MLPNLAREGSFQLSQAERSDIPVNWWEIGAPRRSHLSLAFETGCPHLDVHGNESHEDLEGQDQGQARSAAA